MSIKRTCWKWRVNTLRVISATLDKSMATDVESEGNEKTKLIKDTKEEVSWSSHEKLNYIVFYMISVHLDTEFMDGRCRRANYSVCLHPVRNFFMAHKWFISVCSRCIALLVIYCYFALKNNILCLSNIEIELKLGVSLPWLCQCVFVTRACSLACR